MPDTATERNIQTAVAWCWLDKPMLRHIREHADNVSNLDQVLAVYLALAEAASDHTSQTFTITRRRIESTSGVSLRKVQDCLSTLRTMKAITWTQNRNEGTSELGPNTYTLLALGGSAPAALGSARTQKRSPHSNRTTREKLKNKEDKPPANFGY